MRRHLCIMRGPLYFGLSLRFGRILWEPSLLAQGWVREQRGTTDHYHYAPKP